MKDDEIEKLAALVAVKMEKNKGCCLLTTEETIAVKELLRTKKNAVRLVFYIFGALTLWAIKDIYIYVVHSISFK